MKNFLIAVLEAFLRMDGLEKFGAIVVLVSLFLMAGITLYRVIDAVQCRMRANAYRRKFDLKVNQFKKDADKEDLKEGAKSIGVAIGIFFVAILIILIKI